MTLISSTLRNLDPNIAMAVDALLNATKTGLCVKDVATALDLNENNIALLMQQIAELKAAPPAAPVSFVAHGTTPSGSTGTRKASELFSGPKGEKSELLDFNVPFFTWEHKHPLVPEVNPHYKFKLDHLIDFLWAVVNRKNVWLYGHTGTGKTTFIEQVCARLGWPVSRINLDSGIERIDLLGKTGLKADGGATVTTWENGLIPQAMEAGHFLIIDEIDFGRSDVLYAIQRALEGNGLVLTEDSGRCITPHPMFRIAATANTRGQGDEYGLYQGAKVQSTALLNRFAVWLEIDYLDEEDEAMLLHQVAGLSQGDAQAFATFASEVRIAFKNGELNLPLSPREIIPLASAFNFFSSLTPRPTAIQRALKMVVMNKTTPDNRVRVEEIANRALNLA